MDSLLSYAAMHQPEFVERSGLCSKRDAGVGRSNTRDRLAAMYGDAAKLVGERLPAGGVRARVRLPLRV